MHALHAVLMLLVRHSHEQYRITIPPACQIQTLAQCPAAGVDEQVFDVFLSCAGEEAEIEADLLYSVLTSAG